MHILSHSHMDVGWLQRVNDIYTNVVRNIYNTTIKALDQNPGRRFVAAESVFFSRWWNEQPDEVRKMVRDMVESGRLQFVGGGWVQNDEAVPHYTTIIDQMTLGLRFLNDTFGPQCGTPSVAWQADPFGHSVSQASLFARMGFSSLMIGRITFTLKDKWSQSHSLEFVWQADPQRQGGDGGHIFAWVPENTYVNPGHISFGSEYCMYSEESYEFQDTRVPNLLLTYAERQTEMYTNDTVAMMSGGDLAFTRGDCRFQKQDAFITTANRISQAMQQRTPVYVVHSTPACYIEALRAKSRTWPRYSGDLLPYTDMPGRTWTGFYTTRPSQKMLVRYANGFLQASKQLSVLGSGDTSAQVRHLGEAVATLLHHDAITGTSMDDVAKNYTDILSDGIESCERLVSTTLVSLLDPGILRTDELAKRLGFCHLLNQSDCKHTTANNKAPQFGVVIYNPASVRVSPYVRLPLSTGDSVVLSVTGPGGTKVESQVVPLAPHRHKIPERQGIAESSLVFQANVQALGASIYHVKSGKVTTKKLRNFLEIHEQDNYIENERYRVEIEPGTGLVSTIVLRQPQASVKLHQSFGAYAYGDDSPEQVRSPGHYVFSAYSEARAMGDQVIHRVVKGPVVQEIHQIFNDYISQVISLQKNSPFIEFTWTVGPLTKLMASTGWAKKSGCDVVSQFESNLNSSEFYTDSNGWKNMRRIRTLQSYALPIPSNYYPVTSWIYIKDRIKGLQMMILPDRPQGGSSLRSGQLELMVHRRHNTNDNLGVGEVLQETGSDGAGLVAKGTHRLFLGSIAEAGPLLRPQALQLVYRPLLVFAPAGWRPKNEKFTGLRAPLPSTVHVLTLERLSANQVLLRLEHLAVTKAIVMLNVTRLLTGHLLKDLQPVTLAANQFLSNATRQHWPTGRFGQQRPQVESVRMIAPEIMTVPSTGDNVVRLKPRQIVTFLATLVDE